MIQTVKMLPASDAAGPEGEAAGAVVYKATDLLGSLISNPNPDTVWGDLVETTDVGRLTSVGLWFGNLSDTPITFQKIEFRLFDAVGWVFPGYPETELGSFVVDISEGIGAGQFKFLSLNNLEFLNIELTTTTILATYKLLEQAGPSSRTVALVDPPTIGTSTPGIFAHTASDPPGLYSYPGFETLDAGWEIAVCPAPSANVDSISFVGDNALELGEAGVVEVIVDNTNGCDPFEFRPLTNCEFGAQPVLTVPAGESLAFDFVVDRPGIGPGIHTCTLNITETGDASLAHVIEIPVTYEILGPITPAPLNGQLHVSIRASATNPSGWGTITNGAVDIIGETVNFYDGITITGDGDVFAVCCGEIYQLDADTGAPIQFTSASGTFLEDFAWSPIDGFLYGLGTDGVLRVFDDPTETTIELGEPPMTAMAIDADGVFWGTDAVGQSLYRLNLEGQPHEFVGFFGAAQPIRKLAFAPDGILWGVYGDLGPNTLAAIDTQTGAAALITPGLPPIASLTFSPNPAPLVTPGTISLVGDDALELGEVGVVQVLVDNTSFNEPFEFRPITDCVPGGQPLLTVPAGSTLAFDFTLDPSAYGIGPGIHTCTLSVTEAVPASEARIIEVPVTYEIKGPITAAPDDGTLYASFRPSPINGTGWGTVDVIDGTANILGDTSSFYDGVAITADGDVYAACCGELSRLDTDTGAPIRISSASGTFLEDLAWSPADGLLYGPGADGQLYQFDPVTEVINTFPLAGPAMTTVAIDADGVLWGTDAAGTSLYRLNADGQPHELIGPFGLAEPISDLTANRNGQIWGVYGGNGENTLVTIDSDTGAATIIVTGLPRVASFAFAPVACPVDLDGDGAVGLTDLLAVLATWGPCPSACPADLNGNGSVELGDLLAVLAAWGSCS
ncbi:MAG: hypothetical protein AB8G96_16650 [Phycisphaerales bacterium]